MVKGDELAYRANAELTFRLGAVTAALDTRWDLSAPPAGGDTHRSVIRGTRAEILVEQHEGTGFRRRLSLVPLRDGKGVRAALTNAVAAWQAAHPGLDIVAAGATCEIRLPRSLDVGHEAHFPLMLADFLALIDGGRMPPGARLGHPREVHPPRPRLRGGPPPTLTTRRKEERFPPTGR
jgi:hypothetical protein